MEEEFYTLSFKSTLLHIISFLKVLFEDEHRRRSKEVHQPGIQYLQPTARTPSGGGGHGAHAHGAHASAMYMKPHPQILMQGKN